MPETMTFSGYTAEMSDLDDGRKGCDITGPEGEYGSLAVAMETGTLTLGDEDVDIPEEIVSRIEQWALANGY